MKLTCPRQPASPARGIALALLATTSPSIGALAGTPANAQTATSYDIPAGALPTVLNQFAHQAHVELIYDAPLTQNVTSPGLKGSYGAAEGLSRILAGTGLTYRQTGANMFTLERAPITDAGEVQLGPVRVEGNNAGGIAANLASALQSDGTAAQGYRSDRVSAVGPWEGRSLQDTPYSVTVVPREMIDNLQATTPDQIFRVVPTVQFSRPQYENDQPSLYIRGFNVLATARDGVMADYRGFGTTTEDVERVEVFTGLSGFLYGPGNVGGLINYVSKRPTAEPYDRFTVGNNGGSNWYVLGDVGGPIDSRGRFGYRINGIWQGGETAIDNQRIRKRFISGALDWHVTDKLLWQFDAAYRDYDVHGVQANWVVAAGVRPRASDIDSSVSWSQPWAEKRFETQRYGTQLRWDASDAFTLRAGWRYTRTPFSVAGALNLLQGNGTYTQLVYGQYAPGDNAHGSTDTSQAGQIYADIRFNTGSIAHKLTIGGQYQTYWTSTYTNSAPAIFYSGLPLSQPTYFDKPVQPHVDRGPSGRTVDQSNRSGLIGDDITFNDQWSLLAGVAFSNIDVAPVTFVSPSAGYNKSAVTPNVSLIFKPVESVTTYATYIESLEQGGVAGSDFNGVPVVNAGEVFKPLISRQVEVGAKWSVGGMLLTGALFQIDRALQYYDQSNPAAIRFLQDGREVHRGFEFTAFGKLTSNLTVTGGVTLLDAKITKQQEDPTLEGNRPPNVADTLVKLHGEYRLPFVPGLSLTGGVIYTGPQYGDAANTDRLPGFAVFDIGARYEIEIASHPLTFRLDVNNLTDKAYWFSGSVLGEPRTVLFSVSTRF